MSDLQKHAARILIKRYSSDFQALERKEILVPEASPRLLSKRFSSEVMGMDKPDISSASQDPQPLRESRSRILIKTYSSEIQPPPLRVVSQRALTTQVAKSYLESIEKAQYSQKKDEQESIFVKKKVARRLLGSFSMYNFEETSIPRTLLSLEAQQEIDGTIQGSQENFDEQYENEVLQMLRKRQLAICLLVWKSYANHKKKIREREKPTHLPQITFYRRKSRRPAPPGFAFNNKKVPPIARPSRLSVVRTRLETSEEPYVNPAWFNNLEHTSEGEEPHRHRLNLGRISVIQKPRGASVIQSKPHSSSIVKSKVIKIEQQQARNSPSSSPRKSLEKKPRTPQNSSPKHFNFQEPSSSTQPVIPQKPQASIQKQPTRKFFDLYQSDKQFDQRYSLKLNDAAYRQQSIAKEVDEDFESKDEGEVPLQPRMKPLQGYSSSITFHKERRTSWSEKGRNLFKNFMLQAPGKILLKRIPSKEKLLFRTNSKEKMLE